MPPLGGNWALPNHRWGLAEHRECIRGGVSEFWSGFLLMICGISQRLNLPWSLFPRNVLQAGGPMISKTPPHSDPDSPCFIHAVVYTLTVATASLFHDIASSSVFLSSNAFSCLFLMERSLCSTLESWRYLSGASPPSVSCMSSALTMTSRNATKQTSAISSSSREFQVHISSTIGFPPGESQHPSQDFQTATPRHLPQTSVSLT